MAILLSLSSCFRMRCVDGNHKLESQNRYIKTTFTGVELQTSIDLELKNIESDTIVVEAESNLQSLIITEVKNGILIIKTPHGRCIEPHEKITVSCKLSALEILSNNSSGTIKCNEIKSNVFTCTVGGSGSVSISKIVVDNAICSIEGSGDILIDSVIGKNTKYLISGSGNLKTKKTVCESATLSIEGSGFITSKLETKSVDVNIDGSGKMEISGSGTNAQITINSSGDFEGYPFCVKNCNAKISGSGDIKIFVSDNLDASISGSGSIKYDGSPKVTKSISGSGSVTRK